MPGFKQVPAGSSYSRITKGRLSQKLTFHISTSEAAKKQEKNRGLLTFLGVCGVARLFQTIKEEL